MAKSHRLNPFTQQTDQKLDPYAQHVHRPLDIYIQKQRTGQGPVIPKNGNSITVYK